MSKTLLQKYIPGILIFSAMMLAVVYRPETWVTNVRGHR
jgi:hypothetical protein